MYTGLHLGTIPDDEIWDSTPEAHPMEWWEWHLADSAYATCIGILTRYVQPALGALFPHEIYFNTYINFYRQYVEVRGPCIARCQRSLCIAIHSSRHHRTS